MHLDSCQIFMIEVFNKNDQKVKSVKYFPKRLLHNFDSALNTPLGENNLFKFIISLIKKPVS